ncbi:unnamed protein product [Symbiodinium sp. CCMP2456]|nr:unnamed protein product [Symbiodinium sp. CCMP2456]
MVTARSIYYKHEVMFLFFGWRQAADDGPYSALLSTCLEGPWPLAPLCQEPLFRGLRHGYDMMGRNYSHQLHFSYASVRGFVYKQRPSLRDPRWLLQAAAGLHRAVKLERWAEDVRTWLQSIKPSLHEQANNLQTKSERLEDLGDNDLLSHVEVCMDFMELASETHRRFTPASVLPLLNLIDFCRKHVQQWDMVTVVQLVQSEASKTWWQDNFGTYGAAVQGLVTHLNHNLELRCMFELDIQNPEVARHVWEKLEEKPYAQQLLSCAVVHRTVQWGRTFLRRRFVRRRFTS